MQQAMQLIAQVKISANTSVQLAIKTAGKRSCSALCGGDPAIQLIDVLAGATLDRMAAAEHLCQMNEL